MIEPPAGWEAKRLAVRRAVLADAAAAFASYTSRA